MTVYLPNTHQSTVFLFHGPSELVNSLISLSTPFFPIPPYSNRMNFQSLSHSELYINGGRAKEEKGGYYRPKPSVY